MKKVTLYHGTSSQYLDEIKREGLVPRKGKGNYEGIHESFPLVYLTRYMPSFYAMNATPKDGGYQPVILQVTIDLDKAYPDEDYLAIIYKKANRDLHPTGYRKHTNSCYKTLGNVAIDHVPVEDIKGIAILPELKEPANYRYIIPFGAGILCKRMVYRHKELYPLKCFIETCLKNLFVKGLDEALMLSENHPDKMELIKYYVLEGIEEQKRKGL